MHFGDPPCMEPPHVDNPQVTIWLFNIAMENAHL